MNRVNVRSIRIIPARGGQAHKFARLLRNAKHCGQVIRIGYIKRKSPTLLTAFECGAGRTESSL